MTFSRHPFDKFLTVRQFAYEQIKRSLLQRGAEAYAMTGSGPTVFGLYRDKEAATAAFDSLRQDYRHTYLTQFV